MNRNANLDKLTKCMTYASYTKNAGSLCIMI